MRKRLQINAKTLHKQDIEVNVPRCGTSLAAKAPADLWRILA